MRSTGIFAAFAVLAMMFLLCSCGPDRSNKIVMVTEATFPPYEFREGGMYSSALILRREDKNAFSAREEAMDDLLSCLRAHGAKQVFAYNARFDRAHLPELASFGWYDIMALAAYRTYNPCIPRDAPLYSTGRLRRGYGVEPILRLLSGNSAYRETHNALQDALDELTIMELLGHPPAAYRPL